MVLGTIMPGGADKGLGGINGRGAPVGGVIGRLGGIAVGGGLTGRLGRPLGRTAVTGGRLGIGAGLPSVVPRDGTKEGGGETGRGTGAGIGGGAAGFGAAIGEGVGPMLISSGVASPWIFLKLRRMGVKILKLTSWLMAWPIWLSISRTVLSSEPRFWGARTPIITRPIWPASKGIFSSGRWNFSAICPIKTALTSEKSADLRSAGSWRKTCSNCSRRYSITFTSQKNF